MAYSNKVDVESAEELLTDLREDIDTAESIGDTPLAGHFHEVRTTGRDDAHQIAGVIQRDGDGGVTVSTRVFQSARKPNPSRLPDDCIGTVQLRPTPFLSADDYARQVSRLIEDDMMMMGAI